MDKWINRRIENMAGALRQSQFTNILAAEIRRKTLLFIKVDNLKRVNLLQLVSTRPGPALASSSQVTYTTINNTFSDTVRKPTLPDTSRKTTLPDTSRKPTLPDTSRKPTLPDTSRKPTLPDTSREPTPPDTSLVLVTRETS
ncbi:hypothetical protein RRG08_042096 [Elysia crispata]|uniref:Uncharacterized protein n=1 Tax=Elysia crispata TaxID=231223 RepID=A0AAE1AGT9_9GAST|nr:hypothetical protein RRG08_042096 [Elysia crispata]